jgi:phage baseplate assembly protein gpV
MADITTNHSFPFPEPADVVDVTGDIQALAESIDSSLSEIVQDVVGTMVTSNTETGIAVTYNDSTGKLNFDVTYDPLPSQTGNTGKYLTTNGTATSWAALAAIGVSYLDLTNVPATFAPTTHAASHGSAGSDAITIAQSQVTNLTDDLAAKAPQTALDLKASLAGGATFTGLVTTSNGITNAQQKNALVASGYNSASGAFAQASRVIMTATASGSTAPTTRPDGTALAAGDVWISY